MRILQNVIGFREFSNVKTFLLTKVTMENNDFIEYINHQSFSTNFLFTISQEIH